MNFYVCTDSPGEGYLVLNTIERKCPVDGLCAAYYAAFNRHRATGRVYFVTSDVLVEDPKRKATA